MINLDEIEVDTGLHLDSHTVGDHVRLLRRLGATKDSDGASTGDLVLLALVARLEADRLVRGPMERYATEGLYERFGQPYTVHEHCGHTTPRALACLSHVGATNLGLVVPLLERHGADGEEHVYTFVCSRHDSPRLEATYHAPEDKCRT